MIIFGTIFVYIISYVLIYLHTPKIVGYEVSTGSLSVANTYKGLALREEEIVSANSAGYINFFARESEHVASGDLVYTIDSSGKMAEMIESEEDSALLSDDDLSQIKEQMMIFNTQFSTEDFSRLYDFKYQVQGTALKLSNYNMLSNMNTLTGNSTDSVNFCYSPQSGLIEYMIDGYENLQPSDINKDSFDTSKYTKKQWLGNDLVSQTDSVYKLITSENWSVIIPVSKERAKELVEEEYVKVRFLKNQNISWAKVSELDNSDGTYVELDFTNSMITFASERFLDIEILTNQEEGLKIPNSSIMERDFYLIPLSYKIEGGNKTSGGFMRETYDSEGNASTEYVEANICAADDEYYYVDTQNLRIGDYICKPDSMEKYPISKEGSLIGVYNINKGYADFKAITILYSNEEYSIVKSNTAYGLSEYDYIVLDADSVNEDDFIYH